MVRLVRHRRTKEAETDRPNLTPPRNISTLQSVHKENLSVKTAKPYRGFVLRTRCLMESIIVYLRYLPNNREEMRYMFVLERKSPYRI